MGAKEDLETQISALAATVDATQARIAAGFQALQDVIASLQNGVPADAVPALQAQLQAIADDLNSTPTP